MGAPRLNRGPGWLQAAFNALAGYAEAIVPVDGTGVTVSDSSTGKGRSINVTGTNAAAAAACDLGATLATDTEGEPVVQFAYGKIVGRQPTGMSPGNLPPFQLAAASGNYYYASADYDSSTGLWSNPQILIEDVAVGNTTTTCYELLASVGEDDDGNLVIDGLCGDVWFDPCDLAIDDGDDGGEGDGH